MMEKDKAKLEASKSLDLFFWCYDSRMHADVSAGSMAFSVQIRSQGF